MSPPHTEITVWSDAYIQLLPSCLLDHQCTVHHVEFFTISKKKAVKAFLFMFWLPLSGAATCVAVVASLLFYFCFTVSSMRLSLCVPPACLCFKRCVLRVPGIVFMFNSCRSSCINQTVFVRLTLPLPLAAWSWSHGRKCEQAGQFDQRSTSLQTACEDLQ